MRRAVALLLLLFPAAALADGMIVLPRPHPNVPQPFPLSVRYHRVDVAIHDDVAKTRVDQEFFNPTSSRLEGMYIFPLPPGAVISNFEMEIDGKLTPAELLDATKARTIYEDIVRSMRDPALLEYIGKGAFKVRIFPIEPRSTKRVKLSYSEVVRADGGLRAYTYPLNTEKFSSAPLEDVSIHVALESERGLRTIYCPTHDVDVRRRSDRLATVSFEARRTKPDKDFTLYFGTDDKGFGVSVLAHRPAGEDGYFLLTVTPAYDTATRGLAKDVTFVVDTSGSMAGEKMQQAKRALRFCLENLNPDDRFQLIRFSTEAEALFEGMTGATEGNLSKARQYVDEMRPIGGTASEEALTLALRSNRETSSRPKIVIFLTDGKPTIGETDDERLVKKVKDANSGNVRVFTFGIGEDLNTHFLDKLTEATRAARTYVGEKEDLEIPVSRFFEKISAPVLVDVDIDFGPGIKARQIYPRDLPDLFKGSQLVVLGRYSGSGDQVMLTGTVNGRRISIPYTTRFPGRNDGNDVIAPLWAAQRVGFLLDEIRLHGDDRELVDEVTRLARRFGIVTPYTSYLIVEDERRNVRAENQTFAAAPAPPRMAEEMKDAYDAMRQKAGAASVQASVGVEALKNAQNTAALKQGRAVAQSKNIQGRAVYQVGTNWVDSQVQGLPNAKVQRIQFASTEYFDLLKKEPKAAEFLALGRNVRFAVGEQVYEVFE